LDKSKINLETILWASISTPECAMETIKLTIWLSFPTCRG
jgi:hypothetical protein